VQQDEHIMAWCRVQKNPMPLILNLILKRKEQKLWTKTLLLLSVGYPFVWPFVF